MKKHEFLHEAEKHFDLIPKYFFSTLQRKIDAQVLDSQKALLAKWFDGMFVKTVQMNFDNFVLVEWVVELLEMEEGIEFDPKAIKRASFAFKYVKGTHYFKGIGKEKGIFLKTKNEYVKQFFDAKRSIYKSKINKNG